MLVLTGYGLGLFLAAQVGPVTLLIVRSVLRGGRAVMVGLAMAAAVASIDLGYAVVGLAGCGQLLNGGSARLVLGLVSAAILVGIGARTLWKGCRARSGLEFPDEASSSTTAAAGLLVGVALRTLSWYGGFSTAVALARARVGDRLLSVVDLAGGCSLIGFGRLLGYRTLHAD